MTIEYSKDGAIGVITIKNSSNHAVISPGYFGGNELLRFLSDPLLKGVIVQCKKIKFGFGNDDRAWENQVYGKKEHTTILKEYATFLGTITYANVPVAAIIRGDCFHDGIHLALSCHFRFASASAHFGFPYPYNGLFTQWDKLKTPLEILRRQDIISLLLSGKIIESIEAQKIGLIDFISNDNLLKNKAKKYLHSLTDKRSPDLIRKIMESIHNYTKYSKKEALYRESILFDSLLRVKTK